MIDRRVFVGILQHGTISAVNGFKHHLELSGVDSQRFLDLDPSPVTLRDI